MFASLTPDSWPLAPLLAAAPSFPRGPGFYFSLYKLFLLLLVFLAWVPTCNWVDRDSRKLRVGPEPWNYAMLGSAAAGLLALWILPWFWVGFPILVAAFLTPVLVYVGRRNQVVSEADKVLTEHHINKLTIWYLGFKISGAPAPVEEEGPPVAFIGKSTDEQDEDPERVERARESKGFVPAQGLVQDAVAARGTEILLEPGKEGFAVRFKVDGVPKKADPLPKARGEAVIKVFKVLANLDPDEKRKPQEGSFAAEVEDKTLDCRVSTAGGVGGEKLTLKLLDRSVRTFKVTKLGLSEEMLGQLLELTAQEKGLILATGPRGCGKTTTLYACLNAIDRYQRNIVTLESPVEHRLGNVTHEEVNTKAGQTFAGELQRVLRTDPDVVLVSEVKDAATADLILKGVTSGRLLFVALDAPDTATAIGQLLDLGAPPALLAKSLLGVVNQRLLRALCPKCRVRYKPAPDQLRKANLPPDRIKYFYRPPEGPQLDERGQPVVCKRCGGSGYHGSVGMFELLLVNDALRDLIKDKAKPNVLKQEALRGGLKTLYDDGLRQVIEGKTSIQELLRVTK